MARVGLRPDLNMVMARMVTPTVERLTREVAREAALRAPAAKTWISRDDERVRPAHVAAHGQTIPDNLRYRLARQVYVHGGGRGSDIAGHTITVADQYVMARRPRDPSLPNDQKRNCRCVNVTLPGLIARRIRTEQVTVTETGARGRVTVRFNRIVESEHGTGQDRAARFMGGAVDAVAARLSAASARRT